MPPFKADGYKTPAVYRDPSNYSLRFTVKTCENTSDGNECAYHEANFYVGDLNDYELASVFDEPKDRLGLRTDYSAAEVRQLRKNLDDAEKAYRAAQNKLSPFGRYDQ